ncbi:hypothetical protein Bra471DRAFT_00909 [Bradyrhizobium sp. WSM471]|nr:hypothetical protein Bra471DRAFT_00909 [Bradyrhizobium sp. WSM471]
MISPAREPDSPPARTDRSRNHTRPRHSWLPHTFDCIFPGSLTCLNPQPAKPGYATPFPRGRLMFGTETTALLRAVLDDVCESVSHREIEARTHVASKILEAATIGEASVDDHRRRCEGGNRLRFVPDRSAQRRGNSGQRRNCRILHRRKPATGYRLREELFSGLKQAGCSHANLDLDDNSRFAIACPSSR